MDFWIAGSLGFWSHGAMNSKVFLLILLKVKSLLLTQSLFCKRILRI